MDASDWFALGAMLISALALVATVTIHQSGAGRVVVHLNVAAFEPDPAGKSTIFSNTSGIFGLADFDHAVVEIAQVIVQNPGRTGATVTDVAFAIQGASRGLHYVVPPTFRIQAKTEHEPETYFRIEPYDQRIICFDLWAMIDREFLVESTLRRIKVHAVVDVAGHQRQFHSKKHGWWTIDRRTISANGNQQVRFFRNVLLTELARLVETLNDLALLGMVAEHVEEDLGTDATKAEIEEQLRSELRSVMARENRAEAEAWPIQVASRAIWQRERLGPAVVAKHRRGPSSGASEGGPTR